MHSWVVSITTEIGLNTCPVSSYDRLVLYLAFNVDSDQYDFDHEVARDGILSRHFAGNCCCSRNEIRHTNIAGFVRVSKWNNISEPLRIPHRINFAVSLRIANRADLAESVRITNRVDIADASRVSERDDVAEPGWFHLWDPVWFAIGSGAILWTAGYWRPLWSLPTGLPGRSCRLLEPACPHRKHHVHVLVLEKGVTIITNRSIMIFKSKVFVTLIMR